MLLACYHQEGYENGVNGAASSAECPCDANASCQTPAAERVWTNFISPSLLLLAMCIHGIFEGLVLGIQACLFLTCFAWSCPYTCIDVQQPN